MKYVALLRGINVGGKNTVAMSDLRRVCEGHGFQHVSTYINSGNVLVETEEKSIEKITEQLEKILSKRFGFTLRVVVRSLPQLRATLAAVPPEWNTRHDIRCYVAFVKEPVTPKAVVDEMVLKDGIDSVQLGPGVVYMTTLMSGLMKSGFTKLVGKKIYQDITIRNYNTSKKLLTLMEKV